MKETKTPEIEKESIWIESKEFKDRTEFRIKSRTKYPDGIDRKGMFEEYLGYWYTHGDVSGRIDYVFVAYKKKLNLFRKLFGYNNYRNQTKIAIQKCNKIIKEYEYSTEKPIVQKYKR